MSDATIGAGAQVARRRTARNTPWRAYAGMYGFVALLHVLGWGTLVLFVAPASYHVGGKVFGIGLGLTAYTLGLRHAFDADHIAAIDNTTRKIREDRGSQPVSVGFWFSLGHSTVVVLMIALLAFGLHAIATEVTSSNSLVSNYAGVFGASVSGVFLLVIGALNLAVLLGIVGVFRRMHSGEYDEAALEDQLAKRGFMNRFFGGLMRLVRRPVHIYPIGVLFGFGFDTVTEVLLLAIAGSAVATGLPWYAVLVLPVLFTAGMSLMDTTDGAFMNSAYGWAFARPVRRVFYNLTVTTLSVVVAVVIGLVEVIGVISQETGFTAGPIGWIGGLDLNYVGYGIVGLFFFAWASAVAVWKLGRVEERWSARLAAPDSPPE
jgi:high-affinity nickel-transport protein